MPQVRKLKSKAFCWSHSVARYGIPVAFAGMLFAAPAGHTQELSEPVATVSGSATSVPGTVTAEPAFRSRVSDAYGKLPLSFEPNVGQTDAGVKFLSRGRGHAVFLMRTEAIVVLNGPQRAEASAPTLPGRRQKQQPVDRTTLRMVFIGGNPDPRITGREELPGKSNYFIGNDPKKWRANVPTYAKVQYHDLYPDIDLIYWDNEHRVEYDFIVKPGADPNKIALAFAGVDKLEIDGEGTLVLHTAAGAIRQPKPVIYQTVDGARREIPGSYVLGDSDQVRFRVNAYDASQPLVIDPVLFYSTYLGGIAEDSGSGIAVDAVGNAYVTGQTLSANFPTTAGTVQTTFAGVGSAFVTKLNPTGSALLYSTYLGGSGNDSGVGIAVDGVGNAYVTGLAASADFPTTAGAFQTVFGGIVDAFVAKLNPTGSALLYSTYLGGDGQDVGAGIAVDTLGNAYVAGSATSDFPTTAGAFQTTFGGSQDAFVTKLNPTGSALMYSTYIGGTGADAANGIRVDAAANAYVTGPTSSTNFPTTAGAFQPTLGGGGFDAFVAKLNPAGSSLVYSTYLGGDSFDFSTGIAVDALGNAYVTGQTVSANFPTTAGALQTTFGGAGGDAFVTKFNPAGTVVYSSYLGGSDADEGDAIAVDALGNAYITGVTNSTNFPATPGGVKPCSGGDGDAFVTKLNPTGSALVYSTCFGGSGYDNGLGIAVDSLPSANAYLTGYTFSTDFSTTAGAFQTTFGGRYDAFVTKIIDSSVSPQPTIGKVIGGGSINVTGGTASFGFIVQRQAGDASIQGDLQYVNRVNGVKVRSVRFDSLVIGSNTATFSGTCTNNGGACTFTVNVTDNGEPGSSDSFNITVDAQPAAGADETLRSGNIQIHK